MGVSKAEVKEYLDNLVRIYEESNKTHELTKDIKASLVAGDVLVYDGIETLADAVGEELIEEPFRGAKCKFRYHFNYRGVTFETYEIKRLKRYVGTDLEEGREKSNDKKNSE